MARTTYTEDLTAQVDGVSTSFTVAGGPYIGGTLIVIHNGIRLRSGPGLDFEENPPALDGFSLGFTPMIGDSLQVQFEIDDVGAGFPLVIASGMEDF